ncbi:MAG: HAMP domain-containing sensor histidine kinase [Cyclobacteriaceae bacterium]
MTKVLLLGIFAGMTHVVMDVYHGVWAGVGIDLFLMGNLGIIYFLNRKGYYVLSRLYLAVFINLALYLVCMIVPRGYGVYMLFLPMVCLPFLLFGYARHYLRLALSLMPVALFVLLEATDYYSFIPFMLVEGQSYSFLLNFMCTALVTFFVVDILYKAHKKSENNLRNNQERLKLLTTDIQEQNLQLEKANRELDRFVYSASHDLKAPLASIKGLIDLARRDRQMENGDYLMMMEERVDHLEKFIYEITTYSRNSRQVVNPEYVWLPALVDDVIKSLRFMPGAEQIRLELCDEVGERIFTDKYRLTIILNNLISNAIKYHDLDQPDPLIRLHVLYKVGLLHIAVEDNGLGIDAEQQHRIFEMFYRGTENSDGTGLGLYIAREVADKLDGTIVVESKEKGTCFTFIMPIGIPQSSLAEGPETEAVLDANL